MSGALNKHDKALHDLICLTLRGQHSQQMKPKFLPKYNYNLGVALHNTPSELLGKSCQYSRLSYEAGSLNKKASKMLAFFM